MCGIGKFLGNTVKGIFKNPLKTIGDVAAIATGNPELIPLINGGTDLVQGKGVGAALKDAAGSFAGSEIFGAATNQFPETFGSINDYLGTNISTSGNSLTDLLGQTSGAGNIVSGLESGFGDISSAFGFGGGDAVGGTGTVTSTEPLSFASAQSVSPGTAPAFDTSGFQGFGQDTLGGGGAGNFDTSSFASNVGRLDPGAAGGISDVAANAATPSVSSFDNFLANPSGKNALGVLKANSSSLLPAAGLAFSAAKGDQLPKGYNQLESQANQLAGQGAQLQSYLNSGTLPPGAESGLREAEESAKAAIRSQYAARGMSGSSAEQQDLTRVDQQIQSQGFEMALSLLQQGVNEGNLASGIYKNLMSTQLKQDEDLTAALTSFGSAMAGGTPANTLQLKVA